MRVSAQVDNGLKLDIGFRNDMLVPVDRYEKMGHLRVVASKASMHLVLPMLVREEGIVLQCKIKMNGDIQNSARVNDETNQSLSVARPKFRCTAFNDLENYDVGSQLKACKCSRCKHWLWLYRTREDRQSRRSAAQPQYFPQYIQVDEMGGVLNPPAPITVSTSLEYRHFVE